MSHSLSDIAEKSFANVPAELRDSAQRAWEPIAPVLETLPLDERAWEWVAMLPRVLAVSEFVGQVARRDAGLFDELLQQGRLFQAVAPGDLAGRVEAQALAASDEAELMQRLRVIRNREMVRLAWRDISGTAALREVVASLSELADASIHAALTWLTRRLHTEVGVPKDAQGNVVDLAVLGFGKLGGRELNFSSDVDLVFVYAEEGDIEGASISHHEFFVRLCRSLVRVLSEATGDGFVFRVDTRLRPFGTSGPPAISFDAMEHYYQVHGREWERYALIKARSCAGDLAAGAELLARLKPFVFRRYLDFGALESIRDMKQLIAREVARKGMSANVKLGPGGIREIEFIAQALQLIRAGREPKLQERATLNVLPLLVQAGYLDAAASEALMHAYVFLRTSEHRLQMVADRQTHDLPDDPIGRLRLAYGMGFPDWSAYEAELDRQRARVHAYFEDLLGAQAPARDSADTFERCWAGVTEGEEGNEALRSAGFADHAAVAALLKGMREGSMYRALSTEGRTRLDRLMPLLLREAAKAADSNVTITRLVNLVEAIGRRSAYFALLTENPVALTQLVNLAAASPWIATWISQHPALLDELLDPRELYALPERALLEAELDDRLKALAPDDMEAQMEELREFRNAHLLRVAAAAIGPGLPPDQVGMRLAQLADVIVAACLRLSYTALVERHGPPGGDAQHAVPGFSVIGYGKLGSYELGYASDLDMIYLYQDVDGAVTTGSRSISNEQFFARVAQRLINMLTTRTAAGILYPVDARLRPSGNAGPLVTSLTAFGRYQRTQAWTWEHQALVRARPVAGDPALSTRFGDIRKEVLCRARDELVLKKDVVDMRERMLKARPPADGGFDVKHDRGGMVDIEFMVQYWVLRWAHTHPDVVRHTDNINILEALISLGVVPAERGQLLINTYRRYLSIEHRLKLMERGTRVPHSELGGMPESIEESWRDVFERE
jgi:[glutamine synthetase] adenylyltransferase / [glutamine synthetase]-adenylyl-L-tyrosine phosphorylase